NSVRGVGSLSPNGREASLAAACSGAVYGLPASLPASSRCTCEPHLRSHRFSCSSVSFCAWPPILISAVVSGAAITVSRTPVGCGRAAHAPERDADKGIPQLPCFECPARGPFRSRHVPLRALLYERLIPEIAST